MISAGGFACTPSPSGSIRREGGGSARHEVASDLDRGRTPLKVARTNRPYQGIILLDKIRND
jgi:hypothetical protein